MQNSLTIRAYTRQQHSHIHSYHQLVFPILGSITIEMGEFNGKVTVGECVIIPSGTHHGFKANEFARFIVADLDRLPCNLTEAKASPFSISSPLQSYLSFIKDQLENKVSPAIEEAMINMLFLLVEQEQAVQRIHPRIHAVLEHIQENLASNASINDLSQLAHLSQTQFKKVFKNATGQSPYQYITTQRMEKAKALLTHTDTPVQIVSEQVGYQDASAFSRRFSLFYGLSPSQSRK